MKRNGKMEEEQKSDEHKPHPSAQLLTLTLLVKWVLKLGEVKE